MISPSVFRPLSPIGLRWIFLIPSIRFARHLVLGHPRRQVRPNVSRETLNAPWKRRVGSLAILAASLKFSFTENHVVP